MNKSTSTANSTSNALKTTTQGHHYPEIQDIRQDLESLRHNVVELTKHIGNDGKGEVRAAAKEAKKRANKLRTAGKHELKKLEGEIQDRPLESIAMALAAGAVLSFLFRRK